jgi:chemotaxis protein methyltransferase CheR
LFLGHAETLWQITEDFTLVSLGDAFVYRRQPEQGERRPVLPDRRTEAEPRPTKADRRRGPFDRRRLGARAARAAAASPAAVEARPAHASAPVAVPPSRVADNVDPMVQVRRAVAAGNYADAADLAAEVVAATPLRSEAHYLQGLALTNLGRDQDALVVLRKAVYLDAHDGFAHFLLAGALERLGEHLAAGRSYRAAADTLGRRTKDAVADELGGRSVAELAKLCRELAVSAERVARLGRRR